MKHALATLVLGMVTFGAAHAQTPSTDDGSSIDLQAGYLALASQRNAMVAGRIGKGDAVQHGFEAALWVPSLPRLPVLGRTDVGLSARLFGGGFSRDSSVATPGSEAVGNVANIDADLYAGRRLLHVRLGYGIRRFSGAFRRVNRSFARLGGRSLLSLGSNREFEVMLSGTVYLGVTGGDGGSGHEGETRLIFSPQCTGTGAVASLVCGRTFVVVGYRFEQFTARFAESAGGNQPEEIGSLVFGAGIRFPPRRD